MPKLTFKKIFKHLRTVQNHRKWVRRYCFRAGIPWRGLTHDLSKYSPKEFFESARYWTGTSSPIEESKKENGVCKAWQHHKGHNPHHWAYWVDNISEGAIVHPMPEKDFIEMVCDFLGAARVYNKDFSYQKEYDWWKKERDSGQKAMNEANKTMLNIILSDLAIAENPEAHRMTREMVLTPEELINSDYIRMVYRRNCGKNE